MSALMIQGHILMNIIIQGMVVLKETECLRTVSTLGGCGGLERTDF